VNRQSWEQAVRYAERAVRTAGWQDWLAFASLFIIAMAAIAHARSYSGVIIDDAFITFRYSWNLIHGNGLTYNLGERVEGTSSSLFAVLMAVPIALGADPHSAAGWLGSIAFAGCCVAAYFGVRACVRDESSRPLALSAAAIVASSSQLAFHSQTGLETVLYASLVAAGIAAQLNAAVSERPSAAWASLFGVAALFRIEGVLFFLLAFAIGCAWRGRAEGAWARAKLEFFRFAVVFGPWLVFRLAYFGSLLPNSVLAKRVNLAWLFHSTAHAALDRLLQGPSVALLRSYVQDHLLATALLVGALLLDRTRQAGVTAVAFALGCAGLVVWSDGDWMPYARLLTPCIVPLAIGAVVGLRGFFFHGEQRTRLGHFPSYALAGLSIALIIARARTPLDVEAVRSVNLDRMREMGKRLAPLARRDDLVATETAGILPYYWGTRTLDMLGLCDRHIARSGTPAPNGSGREDLAYVLAKRPTFYAFNFVSEAARLYAQPEFARHHDEYALLQFPYRYLYPLKALPIILFVRKDRKDIEQLAIEVRGRLLDPGVELRRLGYLR